MKTTPIDPMKRKLITLIGLLPWLPACSAAGLESDEDLASKFRGIRGVVIRIDAVIQRNFITIETDSGRIVGRPRGMGPGGVSTSSYSGGVFSVPREVRFTWRDGDVKNDFNKGWVGGTIIGDYTIEVASRIPDAVLDSIRNKGGALRIKFRLKDDGVLLGWDIERPGGGISRFDMPGGDFHEAKIFNGKVVKKGWYIDKNGQKIETDW